MLLSTNLHDIPSPDFLPPDVEPSGMTATPICLPSSPDTAAEGRLSRLVTRAQNSDNEALQELLGETEGLTWSILWKNFRDAPPEVKQDIAQSVHLKLTASVRQRKLRAAHDGAVVFYVQQMTRRTAYDHLKHYRKYRPLPTHAFAEEAAEAGTATPPRCNVKTALARLSPAERGILLLKAHGMTFRQIAEHFALTMHEVTKRYYQAVEKMKALLSDSPFSFAGC